MESCELRVLASEKKYERARKDIKERGRVRERLREEKEERAIMLARAECVCERP
jgi:hypothetical protein